MATRLSLILLCGSAMLLGCVQTPGRASWHQVTGGDFTLHGCGEGDASLALAVDLREARVTLASLFPAFPRRDRVPFTAYVFCRGSDYTEFAPQPGQSNHFVAGLRDGRVESSYETQQVSTRTSVRGTFMAVRGARLRSARDLVQHHYIHHLIRAPRRRAALDRGGAGHLRRHRDARSRRGA